MQLFSPAAAAAPVVCAGEAPPQGKSSQGTRREGTGAGSSSSSSHTSAQMLQGAVQGPQEPQDTVRHREEAEHGLQHACTGRHLGKAPSATRTAPTAGGVAGLLLLRKTSPHAVQDGAHEFMLHAHLSSKLQVCSGTAMHRVRIC
jgi:hypothetical protein